MLMPKLVICLCVVKYVDPEVEGYEGIKDFPSHSKKKNPGILTYIVLKLRYQLGCPVVVITPYQGSGGGEFRSRSEQFFLLLFISRCGKGKIC